MCIRDRDKSLAYARHFPAIQWLTSYSEYLNDLAPWYQTNVDKRFVDHRNQLMAILNQESSLMEIVKLIGSDGFSASITEAGTSACATN